MGWHWLGLGLVATHGEVLIWTYLFWQTIRRNMRPISIGFTQFRYRRHFASCRIGDELTAQFGRATLCCNLPPN